MHEIPMGTHFKRAYLHVNSGKLTVQILAINLFSGVEKTVSSGFHEGMMSMGQIFFWYQRLPEIIESCYDSNLERADRGFLASSKEEVPQWLL